MVPGSIGARKAQARPLPPWPCAHPLATPGVASGCAGSGERNVSGAAWRLVTAHGSAQAPDRPATATLSRTRARSIPFEAGCPSWPGTRTDAPLFRADIGRNPHQRLARHLDHGEAQAAGDGACTLSPPRRSRAPSRTNRHATPPAGPSACADPGSLGFGQRRRLSAGRVSVSGSRRRGG